MKKIALIIFLILCQLEIYSENKPFESNEKKFLLLLTIERKEISKDNNSIVEKFKIDNDFMLYEYSYSGYHPNKTQPRNRKLDKKLASQDLDKIKSYLNENQLLKNSKEKYPFDAVNNTKIVYTIELEIFINKESYKQTLVCYAPEVYQHDIYQKTNKLKYFLFKLFN